MARASRLIGGVLLGAYAYRRVTQKKREPHSGASSPERGCAPAGVEGHAATAERPRLERSPGGSDKSETGGREPRGVRADVPRREAHALEASDAGGKETRGRTAESPSQIPKAGWRDIALRVKNEVSDDNVSFVAAGVAFYAFLSIFPALAAIISIYGLLSNPADVERQIMSFSGALPKEARGLLGDQLKTLAARPQGALGFGAIFGILLAIWSANKGTSGLVQGLNIVYDEKERRGFIKLNALTMALTFGGVLLVIFAAASVIVLPAVIEFLPLPLATERLVSWLRWPLLAGALMVALSVVYRYGPSRDKPKWRWITWGSGVATALWILGSLAFSFYVSNFGSFGETYGTVAAVVILLLWLNLSSFVVLLGAEINSEIEHQTAKDTTAGQPKPLGKRGALMADTVGQSP